MFISCFFWFLKFFGNFHFIELHNFVGEHAFIGGEKGEKPPLRIESRWGLGLWCNSAELDQSQDQLNPGFSLERYAKIIGYKTKPIQHYLSNTRWNLISMESQSDGKAGWMLTGLFRFPPHRTLQAFLQPCHESPGYDTPYPHPDHRYSLQWFVSPR